uniref:Uncharacterized protein n=1 Tax=Anguilla anguilla TaxID=7936 RepID=A0A0E9PKC5_ANGAN
MYGGILFHYSVPEYPRGVIWHKLTPWPRRAIIYHLGYTLNTFNTASSVLSM